VSLDLGTPSKLATRQQQIEAWRALYEADIDKLRELHSPPVPVDQKYLHDPLPEAISQAYADYLFSQPPKMVAEEGQEQLDAWLKSTDLLNQLVDLHLIVSSEGELFYRINLDVKTNTVAVEWLTADRCYIVTDGIVVVSDGGHNKENEQLFILSHHRFDGNQTTVTTVVVAEKDGKWVQQTGMQTKVIDCNEPIIGQITNKRDLVKNRFVADSDYKQGYSLLLALDEATSIGGENVTLSAPDMFVFTGELDSVLNVADDRTNFFGSSTTTVAAQLKQRLKRFTFFKMSTSELDESSTPPIKQIEKKFDAQPIIHWREELATTIIKRCGLVQQANDDPAGGASSGVAIKLRYMPTENAAESRRRLWEQALTQIVLSAAALSSIPKEIGGIGRSWKVSGLSVEFGSILPVDDESLVNREVTAVAGEIRSKRQAVYNLNPSWTPEMVDAELDQIQSDLNVPTIGAI